MAVLEVDEGLLSARQASTADLASPLKGWAGLACSPFSYCTVSAWSQSSLVHSPNLHSGELMLVRRWLSQISADVS